jgi:hypothetical protein
MKHFPVMDRSYALINHQQSHSTTLITSHARSAYDDSSRASTCCINIPNTRQTTVMKVKRSAFENFHNVLQTNPSITQHQNRIGIMMLMLITEVKSAGNSIAHISSWLYGELLNRNSEDC